MLWLTAVLCSRGVKQHPGGKKGWVCWEVDFNVRGASPEPEAGLNYSPRRAEKSVGETSQSWTLVALHDIANTLLFFHHTSRHC